MNSAMYDSSFLTERKRDKAISDSFLSRIQNETNPTKGSAPLLGITEQSIINHVRMGQMTQYQKKDGGCTLVSLGCPCGPASLVPPTPTPNPPPCPLDFYWATSIIGTQTESLWGVVVGICGNLYVIGTSTDETTFNSFVSPPVNPTSSVGLQPFGTTLSDNGNRFTFVVKYNGLGTVQWVTKIGHPAGIAGTCDGFGIALDANENVYITGVAQSTFGPDVIEIYDSNGNVFGTLPMSGTSGVLNSYVIKYDTSGFPQWATYFGGINVGPPFAYGTNQSRAIAVDANANVFITGLYANTSDITFYNFNGILPGPVVDTTTYGSLAPPSYNSAESVFVVKILTSGMVDWATNVTISNQDGAARGLSIAVDGNGDPHITGTYYGGVLLDTIVFNSFQSVTPPTINTTSYGYLFANSTKDRDMFVVKYVGSGPNQGQVQWATTIITSNTGGGDDEGLGIAVDPNGNVYVTGYYTTGIDIQSFDILQPPPNGNLIQLTPYGSLLPPASSDAFVVKYSPAGVVTAVTNISGAGIEQGLAITTDTNANVYVTGVFASNVANVNNAALPLASVITPTLGGLLPNDGVPGQDAFVVKYDTTLTALWANRIGAGTSAVRGKGIAVDPNGNVQVVGDYGANINLTSAGVTTGGPVTLNPYGILDNPFATADGFIVKYDTNGQLP